MQIISDADLAQVVDDVSQTLLALNWSMTCAESCTGGWLAKSCTDLSGSSAWFERGFVTYSNASKQECLSVSKHTLEQYGAVSQQTAEAMALGAIQHSHADISVAITGIAGPDGGTKDKPVGTVWFAWSQKNGLCESQCQHFQGDRENIRRQAVVFALKGIIKNARADAISMG